MQALLQAGPRGRLPVLPVKRFPTFSIRRLSALMTAAILVAHGRACGQAPNSAWVYPSATGNLLYRLDERGQRVADYSQCGYRGGTEPLPNVAALIPSSRWVYVNPGSGDDGATVQAAIDAVEALTPDANGWRGVVFLQAGEYQIPSTLTITASGVVLKGVGDSAASGSRLRATAAKQYTLLSVGKSSSRNIVSGTTHNLTQKLVPAGARAFEVDSTSGLAVGHTVIVKRPSTGEWIADIDMDQLVEPWTEGSKDLLFDRVITRIEGNWITVDAPLPQTFESQYGGGQIWRFTWSGCIQLVGIEDLYGVSDYAGSTDEDHGWKFIQVNNAINGWVRNVTAQYFGYAAVSVGGGAKWITVADSQCLDPISVIDGGRRYSFNNEGAELTLFVNCYARKGRHDFVFGSTVPGPNAFVHGRADTVYADSGPHHRWSVGGLFDNVTINGNEINVRNRGNSGTGHGWAGAYMAVWNSVAETFRVRNPPTARNWLVGSVGALADSGNAGGTPSGPVGADPAGTYDSSGPAGKGVHPRSLYYGQLQQRLKWPGSEFREVWLGDVDQHYSTGGTGNAVNGNAAWLAQVDAMTSLPVDAKFDYLVGNRYNAFTFDFALAPGEAVVAASLTVSLRAIVSAATDSLWLESTASPLSFTSLGWTPVATAGSTVRAMEVDPALLADGRLNVALGDDCSVDFAMLHLQVVKAPPNVRTLVLDPVADATVRGGAYSTGNFGAAATLETKDVGESDVHREAYLRWDLGRASGKLVQATVRLYCTGASQAGNENVAALAASDTWGESTLTYDNKPAAGRLFAQWLPVTGKFVEFSVTPQVADALLGDQTLSLKVAAAAAFGDLGNVSYASAEHATAANRPQLVLAFENTAPVIGNVANLAVNEDAVAGALPFTVGDDFTAATALVVSVASSNPSLAPPAGIVLGGSGTNRTVTVTPAANQSGVATITLTVSDGLLTDTDTFVLTVNAVNDAPAIGAVADLAIDEDAGTGAIPFTIGDVETDAGSLSLEVDSSNPTLVPVANVVLAGAGANRTVTVTPAPNQSGVATITLTVGDGTSSTSESFTLTVNAVNDAPTIGAVADLAIDEDTSTAGIPFTIGDVETDTGSLILEVASSNPTLVPTANVVFGGGGPRRTLTVTPAANQSGVATITLTVSDGTLSTSDSFTLTVHAVNDAPVLAAVSNRSAGAGQRLTITNVATDVDLPAQAPTFSLLAGPAGATIGATSGIIDWRPAVAQAGSSCLFRVRVADNGLPVLGDTQQFSVVVSPIPAPSFTQVALTNNLFRLTITGAVGPDYTVEASTNLVDWRPVFTTNSPTIPFFWRDPGAVDLLRRFYRVRLGP